MYNKVLNIHVPCLFPALFSSSCGDDDHDVAGLACFVVDCTFPFQLAISNFSENKNEGILLLSTF